MEKEEESKEV